MFLYVYTHAHVILSKEYALVVFCAENGFLRFSDAKTHVKCTVAGCQPFMAIGEASAKDQMATESSPALDSEGAD